LVGARYQRKRILQFLFQSPPLVWTCGRVHRFRQILVKARKRLILLGRP
jgi:hypothetical protein